MNYYELLKINQDATDELIDAAYIMAINNIKISKLSDGKKQERLKLIEDAYNVLKSPEKRKLYDEIISNNEKLQGSKFSFPTENIDKEKIVEGIRDLAEGKVNPANVVANLKEKHGNMPFLIAGALLFVALVIYLWPTPESIAVDHIKSDIKRYLKYGEVEGISENPESKGLSSDGMHGYYVHVRVGDGRGSNRFTVRVTVDNKKLYDCTLCNRGNFGK